MRPFLLLSDMLKNSRGRGERERREGGREGGREEGEGGRGKGKGRWREEETDG